MKKVNFLTFFWGKKYTDDHVEILFRALTGYCDFDFDFHVITDRLLEVDPDIHQYELWNDYAKERKCWRRMRVFNKATMSFLPHYFALDIDLLILPGFPELVRKVYDNDFTLCLAENPAWPDSPYSGTMWQVSDLDKIEVIWDEFNRLIKEPRNLPLKQLSQNLKKKGFDGSDSAVMSLCFKGKTVPVMGSRDGIISYVFHLKNTGRLDLPDGARVVLFHGQGNDFMREDMAKKYRFVNEYLNKFKHGKGGI